MHALPYDKLTNCNWTARCLLCIVSKWCNALLMALTCRKMTVCRPDVVSIRVRFQDTQKSGAHLFFRIAALLSPSFYITCLWTCGLNLLRCAFLITVNCLLLFKRPLKLQPDQRGWSLKCCRVLQLWECHLITRAHCVASCCVLEEAGSVIVLSARLTAGCKIWTLFSFLC